MKKIFSVIIQAFALFSIRSLFISDSFDIISDESLSELTTKN